MLKIIACMFICILNGHTDAYTPEDYALHFPNKGVVDLVNIWGMPSLTQFTVCFWMQSDDPEGTPFSYAVPVYDNELLIEYYGTGFKLNINNEGRQTSVTANDGKWHQICVSWESTAGSWKLYKDGVLEERGTGLKIGHVIEAGGSLMLAQEQDSLGGGLSASQSFKGKLANVKLWDRMLLDMEIGGNAATFRSDCLTYIEPDNNVYKWTDFMPGLQGKPRVFIPSPCAPEWAK